MEKDINIPPLEKIGKASYNIFLTQMVYYCYLYWKIKEGFKQDEVIQDELDEESDEFKWIFETKDDDNKCLYIKSAFGGKDSEDFYVIIDGYVPKPHAKIVIGPYEPSQKFMLCRKV